MPIPDFVVELRRHVGHAPLWLVGATAVVVHDGRLLLAQRADDGTWAPVTGIVDPGEEPHAAAVREVEEETCVRVRVERLAQVSATPLVTHVNGDQAYYLDHTFACTWVAGEPRVGDDESLAVGWFPLDDLPPMPSLVRERVAHALAGGPTVLGRTS